MSKYTTTVEESPKKVTVQRVDGGYIEFSVTPGKQIDDLNICAPDGTMIATRWNLDKTTGDDYLAECIELFQKARSEIRKQQGKKRK